MHPFLSDPARQGDGLSQGWGTRTHSVQGCCMAGLTLSRYITSKTTQVKPQWKIRLIWGRNSKIIFCKSSYLGTNLTWPIFLSVRVCTHVCMFSICYPRVQLDVYGRERAYKCYRVQDSLWFSSTRGLGSELRLTQLHLLSPPHPG